jgi:hypothetical protein
MGFGASSTLIEPTEVIDHKRPYETKDTAELLLCVRFLVNLCWQAQHHEATP